VSLTWKLFLGEIADVGLWNRPLDALAKDFQQPDCWRGAWSDERTLRCSVLRRAREATCPAWTLYRHFLAQKTSVAEGRGFPCDPSEVHPLLKPHQRDIVPGPYAVGVAPSSRPSTGQDHDAA